MKQEKRSVFVTGSTGLVGSHLLFSLARKGEKIKAGYRNISKLDFVRKIFSYYSDQPDNLFRRIEWIEMDMYNADSLKKLISGSEQVYHCAGTISFESSGGETLIRNNALITGNIVKACLDTGVMKLCHVSSSSALGASKDNKMINESHPWIASESHSPYAISKYLSESEVWNGIKKGLNAVIINPTIILGPGDWNSGSLLFFSRIAGGMPFYTTGVTGYVDVRDVVKSMIILMNSTFSGERFIVSSENLSFRELFSMIAQNLDIRKPYILIPGILSKPALLVLKIISALPGQKSSVTPDNIRSAFTKKYFDNRKIIEATGFNFIPIQRSVEDSCRIYRRENPGKS